MSARRLLQVITVVVLATIVACSSGDGDADGDGGGASGSGEANTGSGTGSNGAAVDLGDFAVPLPDWANAVTPNIGSGALDIVLFNVPIDQQEATVEFYEDWTASQAEPFLRTDGVSGGVTLQSDVELGEDKTTISILAPLDGDDFVSVSVSRGIFE